MLCDARLMTVLGPPGNIMTRIGRLAAERGERTALVEPGGGRITFAELEARTARIAGGLAAPPALRR